MWGWALGIHNWPLIIRQYDSNGIKFIYRKCARQLHVRYHKLMLFSSSSCTKFEVILTMRSQSGEKQKAIDSAFISCIHKGAQILK